MLSARNLCGLLSENTDEHASEYVFVFPTTSALPVPWRGWGSLFPLFIENYYRLIPRNSVFTTHGTLLGYSDSTIIKKARKVAALLGVTWRSANPAQPNNNRHDSEGANSGTLLLKVLTTIRDADGKLSVMMVEIDKMMAAICDVKESLLVAALVEEKKPSAKGQQPDRASDDNDDDQATIKAEELSKATHNKASSDIDQVKPSSDSEHEAEVEEQEPSKLTSSKGKSKEDAENSTSKPSSLSSSPLSSSSSSSKPKPSQMQILIWRVEAMAEALRDDLRDFKMPQSIL